MAEIAGEIAEKVKLEEERTEKKRQVSTRYIFYLWVMLVGVRTSVTPTGFPSYRPTGTLQHTRKPKFKF